MNTALASLPAQSGDLIKSQVSFAQYINPQFGWVGNLKFMQPPNGYQIKLSAPGILTYPPLPANPNNFGAGELEAFRNSTQSRGNETISRFWSVDPTQYEYSMTLIGMLASGDNNITSGNMELGAFAGGQIRGASQAIYIEPLDASLFFLTVYANSNGELITYKLFDNNTETVLDLNEQMFFSPDLHQGSIENPVPFQMASSGVQDAASVQWFEVQPNPFRTETSFRFSLTEAQEVKLSITNISGETVSQMFTWGHSGANTMVWRGVSDAGSQLPPGIYFVRLETKSGSIVKKVVLQ
ncbi:MAG: T9SS type A sorting domain-containing protein [Lewinellaceae bacterium]|nr:T9SS type A sorting domain-containing protein [Lewinellaceae bacterium]